MKRFIVVLAVFLGVNTFAQTPIINNSADVYLQIKKLKILGSVLYIGAHPDDENNTLLPFLAKEKMYRTAYLSLTRGEGGQNLIGPEQGVELGLIRTQELLAARKIDGAEQYFTRAYEFGYSKSSTETLKIWDKEKVLSDIVWVIRKFQPDIIITRFPPDSRAGHGHHAASCILANEAFVAAADSTKFADQLDAGVRPFKAKRILWNTYNFGTNNTTGENQLKIDVGGYNVLLGKSYGEIGAEARSMHKSQGEGRPRRRGVLNEYFVTTGGDTAKTDLMDGVNTNWNRLPTVYYAEKMIDNILQKYNFEKPEQSLPMLVQLYKYIQSITASYWRDKKLAEVQNIIEQSSGLFVEATTNQESIVQGDTLPITFFFNKRKHANVNVKKITIEGVDSNLLTTLKDNENFIYSTKLPIAINKPITQPYWLQQPQTEGMFIVAQQNNIGNADSKPSVEVDITVNIEGQNFIIPKSVQYKYVDAVKGELYQPLQILPPATVALDFDKKIIGDKKQIEGKIIFTNYKKNITLDIDKFINSPSQKGLVVDVKTLSFDSTFEEKEVAYGALIKDSAALYLGATLLPFENSINQTLHQIKYDHIPTQTYFNNALVLPLAVDVKTTVGKVGFIVGAGDKMPEALEQLGFQVDILNEKDITIANLKQYQAIISGIRAFNIVSWLPAKNKILNQYVNEGGNLLIQYVRNNVNNGKKIQIGPYPFTVNSSIRVTEENAKVEFKNPNHIVLNSPNKITNKDFDNWKQERSTYEAETLDANFESIFTMNDTDSKPSSGSLAIASYGKGNVAYISLALFRQLPAGVAGSYRLLANLVALPKKK
jgi:LmbE family N-acetylglucosaminyl deacetylase